MREWNNCFIKKKILDHADFAYILIEYLQILIIIRYTNFNEITARDRERKWFGHVRV